MPYINVGNRMALDPIIDGLVKRLRSIECRPGDCNYTVTRIVLEALRPGTGWSYHDLHDAVGLLRDAAAEIERRLMGPYEDTTILKNGDLACFDETFAHKPLKPTIGVLGDFMHGCLGEPHKPAGHECCCDPSQLPPIQEVAQEVAEKIEEERKQ